MKSRGRFGICSYMLAHVVALGASPQVGQASVKAPVSTGECEAQLFAASIHLTATPVPNCAGCEFVDGSFIDCGPNSSCGLTDDSEVGLKCVASDKIIFACPGDPNQNMIEILLTCAACY